MGIIKNKFQTNKLSFIVLFIGLWLFTLVSHGIYAGIGGLVFILIFLVIEKISLKSIPIFESLVFLLLFIISVLRFQLFLIEDVSSLYIDAFYGNVAKYILCILVWITIRSISLDNKGLYLEKLIAPLLAVHVGFFFLQFIVYLFANFYIDFVEIFTGEASRYEGFLSSLGIIRPTGMMVEPSTYFYVVLALSMLLILKGDFLKYKVLLSLAIVSMYISFSTAALFITTLFVLYIFVTERIKWQFYFFAIVGVIMLFTVNTSILNQVYEAQVSKTTGGGGDIRLALVEAVVNRDADIELTALGAFANENSITVLASGDARGRRIMGSINDSGVFIYMWTILGFLGIVYFIILCFWQHKISKKHLILFLILSLTKIKVFGPLFVFYFAYSITTNKKSLKIKNKEIRLFK